tara:strand:+ start:484 stop:627 length:144 start_codon:yes stop_codon:yes gene_type:complete
MAKSSPVYLVDTVNAQNTPIPMLLFKVGLYLKASDRKNKKPEAKTTI